MSVKCDINVGEIFSTDDGVPQGDVINANELTLYLAQELSMMRMKQKMNITVCSVRTITRRAKKLPYNNNSNLNTAASSL